PVVPADSQQACRSEDRTTKPADPHNVGFSSAIRPTLPMILHRKYWRGWHALRCASLHPPVLKRPSRAVAARSMARTRLVGFVGSSPRRRVRALQYGDSALPVSAGSVHGRIGED